MECGTMDGGTAALMAYAAKNKRQIHLFDSWKGLPKTTKEDGIDAKVWEGEDVGSVHKVKKVMKLLNIDPKRLHFYQGWFKDTFYKCKVNKIALLHIDADFYNSVKLSLEKWFKSIMPGGFIQIDDYAAFLGCRRATTEFLKKHPELKLEKWNVKSTRTYAYYIRKPKGYCAT